MKLHVTGFNADTVRYRFLWGYYVRGFKPWEHCQPCFVGTRADGIDPLMGDGDVELDLKSDYFYLCGVAPGPINLRGTFNLHMAVRAKAGSVATVTSKYGPVFTIEGAEEIAIQGPIEQVGLDESYAGCKNFRFAAQMYPAAVLGPEAARIAIVRRDAMAV